MPEPILTLGSTALLCAETTIEAEPIELAAGWGIAVATESGERTVLTTLQTGWPQTPALWASASCARAYLEEHRPDLAPRELHPDAPRIAHELHPASYRRLRCTQVRPQYISVPRAHPDPVRVRTAIAVRGGGPAGTADDWQLLVTPSGEVWLADSEAEARHMLIEVRPGWSEPEDWPPAEDDDDPEPSGF